MNPKQNITKKKDSCDCDLVVLITLSFSLALSDIDPERHVPDLAKVIGWRDMRIVAMSSGISKIEIENCEQVHHVDLNERTIALLNIYVEKLGRGWGEKLRTSLLRQQKKNKAEQVERILLQENNFRNSHTNT